jgi:hypothetical protein
MDPHMSMFTITLYCFSIKDQQAEAKLEGEPKDRLI